MNSNFRDGNGAFEELRMDGDVPRGKLAFPDAAPFDSDALTTASSSGNLSALSDAPTSSNSMQKKSSECSFSSESSGPTGKRSTGLSPEYFVATKEKPRRKISSNDGWALSSGEDFNFEEVNSFCLKRKLRNLCRLTELGSGEIALMRIV